ncbi:MAG: glycosyl hydrolase family 18 protein [bacterium]|jgi:spore germination protein
MAPQAIGTFAYYTGTVQSGSAYENMVEFSELLTYIGIFSYDFTPEGTLTGETSQALIAEAQSLNIAVLAVITNFVSGEFSPELAHTVLADPERRAVLVEAIYQLLTENNYDGVNLDIENVLPEDREVFTAFVRELSERLRPAGLIMSMAVPAKTGEFPEREWIGAFDYAALAPLNDFLMIMTYEFHWAGGEPGPIAPLPWMEEVLAFALTQIPADKLLLGIPLHGYDWIVPPPAGFFARGVSYRGATSLIEEYEVPVQWDDTAKEPFFFYVSDGEKHEVWFQNPNSLHAKMTLVETYGLRGLGLWPLAFAFPAFWAELAGLFTVIKI